MTKNQFVKKYVKIVGIGLYVAVLVILGLELFSGGQISFLGNSVNLFKTAVVALPKEELVIAYASKPQSLEPTLFNPVSRNYLVDIYEGLVKTDRNLIIRPGLAVSWGLVNPTTWEFRLRPDVKFHNGEPVTVNDVIASIERARTFKGSELKTLLNTIASVTSEGEDRIRIKTNFPDPLLLNKLAVTFVFPAGTVDFEQPVGTGPYKFVSSDEYREVLNAFADYWGDKPVYRQVTLEYIASRNDRVAALEKEEVQLLANLPPSVGCSKTEKYNNAEGCMPLKNPNIVIKSIPSLEVSFLVFNQKNSLLNNRDVRDAITKAFDPKVFTDLAYGFAREVGQYVSSGVFGFNPDIKKPEYDMAAAKKVLEDVGNKDVFKQLTLTFAYPNSLQPIGEYVQSQLEDLGIRVELNPVSDDKLLEEISDATADIYFLGWRSELGDALDFLQAAAHGKDEERGYGLYNGANYMNKKVDELIEQAQSDLDAPSRLTAMQEAMKILAVDDIYGVPLYESETIFAYLNYLDFEPRVDGYIYASEIK